METKDLKKEFERWINSNFSPVWCKSESGWVLLRSPHWDIYKQFIVDDKHANLRKLQLDNLAAKFQVKDVLNNDWIDCDNPNWDIDLEYRVKPTPKFKEDDWIYYSSENVNLQVKNNIEALENDYYIGLYNANHNKCVSKWEPSLDEWCVFWNEETKHYIVGMYLNHKDGLHYIDDCSLTDGFSNVAPIELVNIIKKG